MLLLHVRDQPIREQVCPMRRSRMKEKRPILGNTDMANNTMSAPPHDPFIGDLVDPSLEQEEFDPLSQSGRPLPSDLRVAAHDQRSVRPAHDGSWLVLLAWRRRLGLYSAVFVRSKWE
jgi:hypothetical protein